jgi:hypothetical protein
MSGKENQTIICKPLGYQKFHLLNMFILMILGVFTLPFTNKL